MIADLIAIALYVVFGLICLAMGRVAGEDVAKGYDESNAPNLEGVGVAGALAFVIFVAASALVLWG